MTVRLFFFIADIVIAILIMMNLIQASLLLDLRLHFEAIRLEKFMAQKFYLQIHRQLVMKYIVLE